MSDPQPIEPRPISREMHTVFVVRAWPERITVTEELLRDPHIMQATYDQQAGTLAFATFNGGATYKIDQRPRPGERGPWTATLVPDTARATNRRP